MMIALAVCGCDSYLDRQPDDQLTSKTYSTRRRPRCSILSMSIPTFRASGLQRAIAPHPVSPSLPAMRHPVLTPALVSSLC